VIVFRLVAVTLDEHRGIDRLQHSSVRAQSGVSVFAARKNPAAKGFLGLFEYHLDRIHSIIDVQYSGVRHAASDPS
jgi:hypothetical protein